jgi:L-rhamnose isomerase
MFGSLPQPAHMPCPDCGVSVPREAEEKHTCDRVQRTSYELFQIRVEADRFDTELTSWLSSPGGRFAVYYVERERRRAA